MTADSADDIREQASGRALNALQYAVAILGFQGVLEGMIYLTQNPEYKGSFRRCRQEIREESKRSEIVGIPGRLQDRVRMTREAEKPKVEETMGNTQATGERITGTVKVFKPEKGYGFIGVPGQRDVFVHRTAVRGGPQNLEEGQRVTFTIIDGPKGEQAAEVDQI